MILYFFAENCNWLWVVPFGSAQGKCCGILVVRERLLRVILVVHNRLPYQNKFGTSFGLLRLRLGNPSLPDRQGLAGFYFSKGCFANGFNTKGW